MDQRDVECLDIVETLPVVIPHDIQRLPQRIQDDILMRMTFPPMSVRVRAPDDELRRQAIRREREHQRRGARAREIRAERAYDRVLAGP